MTAADLSESADPVITAHTQRRYEEERAKRVRDDGTKQFIDIVDSSPHRHFGEDPWMDASTIEGIEAKFPKDRCEILIIGAGWGGILFAVRMVEAGIAPEQIRIVDAAGGFGGAWYWNRYPGLMCDIESYCYLPLLEETGYVPKTRYAVGDEIREYATLVTQKWGIAECGVFGTKAQKFTWDEDSKEWQVDLTQQRSGGSSKSLQIRSNFVVMSSGLLSNPKLPGIPGILDYQGETFHTSRWAYDITGGSSSDPSLVNLQDKRVAIIGTGATSVQTVPALAQWSKRLYIIQRTPGAVDIRGQRKTDEEWFHREVAWAQDWQRQRIRNFHDHITTGDRPDTNLVDDGWTYAPGLVAICGNPDGPKTPEEVPAYVKMLNEIDLPRQDRIRARVDELIKDPATAAKLKPWYPTWCKRPLFHDQYLDSFNRDNVTLLDTAGKGVDRITADSIVIGDESYPVDVIVFATGYRTPLVGSPADKANTTIIGVNGISMSEEWARAGPSTLHGMMDSNFPNLFLAGPDQATLSGNITFNLNQAATHAAYILAQSKRRAHGEKCIIRVNPEAAEVWGHLIMRHAGGFGAMVGCTPGFFNAEAEIDRIPADRQALAARSGFLGTGAESYAAIIEDWRQEGSMTGIEVQV
ncbi:hypothetical protein N7492_006186 [Penicillium capsulatum]|uniref:FAD/NAD(P)-binding domain-containing protein n=1 Tax=Penicillium capsulatum TaxID=69766 RepID=A0A9W9I3A8_9EURO|nr:hypothetical protein N7492_006186 [Penicillium capsulatum]KAJ6108838.1 hypothetical protein N7512_008675 [Penicillium capsulatum]